MNRVTPADGLRTRGEHRGVAATHGDERSRRRVAVVGRHGGATRRGTRLWPGGSSAPAFRFWRNVGIIDGLGSELGRARDVRVAAIPAAPWYGYSHDLDADEPSPRASRSHTHSPAGDPTLELEIATSFNTVLNKMRRLEADLGRPLRSPKHSPGKSQSPTSDARMKRMEKMERRRTWVLENGAAQPVGDGGGASESDPAEPAASPAPPRPETSPCRRRPGPSPGASSSASRRRGTRPSRRSRRASRAGEPSARTRTRGCSPRIGVWRTKTPNFEPRRWTS